MERNQPVPSAGQFNPCRSLRSHLISDVDRPQERLIVICKDECASRVAITRGLLVQSRIKYGNADELVMPQIVAPCEPRNVDDLNLFFQGSFPHNGIVNVDTASTRDATVKKTGHSKRTIILGN